MKRILFTLLLVAAMSLPVFSQGATSWNIYSRPNESWYSGARRGGDLAWEWAKAMDRLMAGLGASGTGKNWYVDSGLTTAGDGSNWANALATLDEAIDASGTDGGANRGDWIHVAQGHGESGTDADLWDADVAGITIKHYGNGSNQGTYTFSDTDTTVSVGAANVTILGGRLLAGISEVVVGMDVTAAADYLTVIAMEFPEPGTAGFEFNIAVQLVSGADNVSFIGCTAYSADETGADSWLNGGASIVNRLTLIGNVVHGEFAVANMFTDQADLECYIAGNTVTNMTTGILGIEFSGNATGTCTANLVITDAIGTSYDTGLMDGGGGLWGDYDSSDTTPVPWTTNETGVNRWGVTELAQIEGEATDAIEADFLNLLIAETVADEVVDDSILADITTTASDWSDFVSATDSLQAISDKVTALTGYVHSGTNSAATSTTPVVAALIGFGDDYFNTDWVMVVLLNLDAVGTSPEGDVRDITNYISVSGTFTIDATGAALASGDIVMVARKESFLLGGIASGSGVFPTGVADDSFLAMLMSKSGTAAASSYSNATDSLEMLSDKLGAFAGTAGATANESLVADIALIQGDLDDILADTAALDSASEMQGLTGTVSVETTGITGAPTAQTLADTLHKDGTFTYDNTTDSLEAIADEQEYSMTVTRTKDGGIDLVSGTNNLFVVSGPVEITTLIGIVAQTLKTVANDCKFLHTSTVPGTGVDLTSAVECSADAAGTSYTLGATLGAALIPTTAGTIASSALKVILPAGTIGFNAAGTFDAGDSIVFYVKYKPLISGARLTASP